jgi:hypothetical protein
MGNTHGMALIGTTESKQREIAERILTVVNEL